MEDIGKTWRSNIEWRDDYVFWTARGVSKTGSLEPHDHELLELGRELAREEALWFYCQIRGQSRRCEGEWRAEFLWLFPQVGVLDLPALPPGEGLREYPDSRPLPSTFDPQPEPEIPF